MGYYGHLTWPIFIARYLLTPSDISQKLDNIYFLFSHLAYLIPSLKNDDFTGYRSANISSHQIRASSDILVSDHPRDS